MQKYLAGIGIGALLILAWFSGCDMLNTQPNHITVNIMATIDVIVTDTNNVILNTSVDTIPVTIIMTKNGGDQLVFQRVVQNGQCQATGVIDLTKGQNIEITATIQSGYGNFYPVAPGTATLQWESVNGSENFGDMYDWYPHIPLKMKQQ